MRHFRSYRGSRRSSGRPRGSTRSAKYIVNQAGASEAAGTIAVSIAVGTDNTTLGQTGGTDIAVPVGAKITVIDMFMPKVNLGAATANFITWSLQRTRTGQAIIRPDTAGGSPLRNNILLTGVLGLGAGQNNSLHIRYKIPPKFQRVADGDVWNVVNRNDLVVSTQYLFIYKVHM